MSDDVSNQVITIAFTREELSTLSSLLVVAMQNFREHAIKSSKEENSTNYAIYTAREKLCALYAHRLADAATIGEPESKDIH